MITYAPILLATVHIKPVSPIWKLIGVFLWRNRKTRTRDDAWIQCVSLWDQLLLNRTSLFHHWMPSPLLPRDMKICSADVYLWLQFLTNLFNFGPSKSNFFCPENIGSWFCQPKCTQYLWYGRILHNWLNKNTSSGTIRSSIWSFI